jgi:predicted nucleic acid-binding protein
MSDTEYLFDTGALIDIYRGRTRIQPYFQSLIEGRTAFISVISEAELWVGLRPDEVMRYEALLSHFTPLPIGSAAARQAGEWMRQHRVAGLGWMDALLTATAQTNRLTVLTRDRRLASLLQDSVGFQVYD